MELSLQINFFNIWAVLVSIVSNMVIGMLWYSPLLFGNVWLKLIGKSPDDISQQDANASMSLSIIPAVVSIVLLALILAFLNVATVLDALLVATIISAGFVGMSAFNLVLFEDRSVALALLNTGYSFVSLNIAAVILTLWR